jgi:transposase
MEKQPTVTIPKTEYDELNGLKTEVAYLNQKLEWLMEQVRLGQKRRFGASSEKSEYDQPNLFNEAEVYAEPLAQEPDLCEVEKHYRKKRRGVADRLPEDLPVEVVEHRLQDDGQVCPVCEGPLHVMGKEVARRELKLVPARAVIVEHVRYTYACRSCEKDAISVPIVKAPMPNAIVKGGFASPEAVAHIATQKFVMGVPLYRQEQEWKRQGILLSRQTMSNWLLRASEEWLEPLYDALRTKLLEHEVLHADETVLQVLREPGKAPQSKSYMWLYRTGSDAKMPIVLLDYQRSRKAEHPKEFLAGWGGYLHADGYSGYHDLPAGITVVGCWAHARRKWDEALKALPQKEQTGSGALTGKRYCDRLFAIERKLADLPPDERHKGRLEQAKPVLDEFLVWLKAQAPFLGKNVLSRAVRYTLDQWVYLERYLLDGRLEISNNRAERSIKPFVIDRKNFLFANTPRGAKASAAIFSIVETAKENGLNPYAYLAYIFSNAPQWAGEHGSCVARLIPQAFAATL